MTALRLMGSAVICMLATLPLCHAETFSSVTLWRGEEKASFTSPEYNVESFDRAVLSWNASGEVRFELEISGIRHAMGRSGEKPQSEKSPSVEVDTLVLTSPAKRFRIHATLQPGATISLLAVTC